MIRNFTERVFEVLRDFFNNLPKSKSLKRTSPTQIPQHLILVKECHGIMIDGKKVKAEERIPLQRRIHDVIQATDGSIWLLTDYKDGELIRLSPLAK